MKKTPMQQKTKKLVLAKETVRELRGADLEKPVAGAYVADRTITFGGSEDSVGC